MLFGGAHVCPGAEQFVVGQHPGLAQSVHTFSDFHVYEVLSTWCEFVVLDGFRWYVGDADTHVFIAIHLSVDVEVGNVSSDHACIWGGYTAGEEKFGGGDVGSSGADITGVVN